MDNSDKKLIDAVGKAYLNRLNSLNKRIRTSESETMTDMHAKALVMTNLCYETFGDFFEKIFDILKQSFEETEKDGEFHNELPKKTEKLEKRKEESMEIEDEFERLTRINDEIIDNFLLRSQEKIHAVRDGSRMISENLAMLSLRATAMSLKEMYTDEDMKNMRGFGDVPRTYGF